MAINSTGIPHGLSTLTPSLNLNGAPQALEFYQAAFNAVASFVMPDASGGVMHGEFMIGNSTIMFCDEEASRGVLSPQAVGGCPLSLNLYVEDCDALTAQALAAGATLIDPLATYPWGERSAMVRDPFGYRWAICTHLEDVPHDEVQRRMATWDPVAGTW